MARAKKPTLEQVLMQGVKRIRVQLDARTTITLKNAQSLASWKLRYPHAKVIG